METKSGWRVHELLSYQSEKIVKDYILQNRKPGKKKMKQAQALNELLKKVK